VFSERGTRTSVEFWWPPFWEIFTALHCKCYQKCSKPKTLPELAERHNKARFEALTTVLLEGDVFWNVRPCWMVNSCFGECNASNIRAKRYKSLFCDSLTVKMKTLLSFETSATIYPSRRRHIPKDLNRTHKYVDTTVLWYAAVTAEDPSSSLGRCFKNERSPEFSI